MSRSHARRSMLNPVECQTLFIESGTSPSPVARKVVDGRCRLMGVIQNKEYKSVAVDGVQLYMFLDLRNGSETGDLLARITFINQSLHAQMWVSGSSIDFPGGSVLFDDGIHMTMPPIESASRGGSGVTLIFQGGSPTP